MGKKIFTILIRKLLFYLNLWLMLVFQAMGLLYKLRNDLNNTTGSPLELWVKRHGKASMQKFKHLSVENGFIGPVPYKLESDYDISKVYIDRKQCLNMVDKLSQVKINGILLSTVLELFM